MVTQPFYNTGTAVLTNGSTAMVGTGTFWMGNIRAFDRVVGLDGKEAIVAAVVDNTHITLARNWPGTTQASLAYEIWMSPDEIFLQTLARQIFETLKNSTLTALATLTPAANKLIYFDSGSNAQLADLTAFARSILDDTTNTAARATLGALGGALGATDNALMRVDGTGGVTAQGSTGATLSDTGALTLADMLVVNKNTAALPTPLAGTVLQIGGADGVGARFSIETFATQAIFTARRSNGTGAARSGLLSGDVIGGLSAYGAYDATNFSSGQRGALRYAASENWSATNQGVKADILVTPNGTTTTQLAATFDQDQSSYFYGTQNITFSDAGGTKFIADWSLEFGNNILRATKYAGAIGSGALFFFRQARGTIAAPSSTQISDPIGGFRAYGYGTSAFALGAQGASFVARATETWSATAFGTSWEFGTTPNGSTTMRTSLLIGQDGSATVTGLVDLSGATAGQIKFPATQNPSADANTFDDYEEGTFTPTILGTGTAGTGTYSVQIGHYVKLGCRVNFDVNLTWSAHTGTTGMKIAGLPFTNGARKSAVTLHVTALTFAATYPQAYVEASATTVALTTVATGAAEATLAMDVAATIDANGSYSVI